MFLMRINKFLLIAGISSASLSFQALGFSAPLTAPDAVNVCELGQTCAFPTVGLISYSVKHRISDKYECVITASDNGKPLKFYVSSLGDYVIYKGQGKHVANPRETVKIHGYFKHENDRDFSQLIIAQLSPVFIRGTVNCQAK